MLCADSGAHAVYRTENTIMAIVVDKLIPEFDAEATGGIKVSNTAHLDQILVLFFYPKDNTPGCTTEALEFRDRYKDFVKAGAVVYGVSRDNMV